MPPLMQRIAREVIEGKQRAKNRTREHAHHGWLPIRDFPELSIQLMDCPCGWVGWLPKENDRKT